MSYVSNRLILSGFKTLTGFYLRACVTKKLPVLPVAECHAKKGATPNYQLHHFFELKINRIKLFISSPRVNVIM